MEKKTFLSYSSYSTSWMMSWYSIAMLALAVVTVAVLPLHTARTLELPRCHHTTMFTCHSSNAFPGQQTGPSLWRQNYSLYLSVM